MERLEGKVDDGREEFSIIHGDRVRTDGKLEKMLALVERVW
jgi:hypothetical protein